MTARRRKNREWAKGEFVKEINQREDQWTWEKVNNYESGFPSCMTLDVPLGRDRFVACPLLANRYSRAQPWLGQRSSVDDKEPFFLLSVALAVHLCGSEA